MNCLKVDEYLLTGITSRDTAIGSCGTVCTNISAASTSFSQKAASSVEQLSEDDSVVSGRRGELTSQRFEDATAGRIVGSSREGSGCIQCGWAGRVGVRARSWGVGGSNSCILSLQVIEISASGDRVSINRDHSKLSLNTFCGEVGESNATRPVVSHGLAEQGFDFCPNTRARGNAAIFTEVGHNVVVGIIVINAFV